VRLRLYVQSRADDGAPALVIKIGSTKKRGPKAALENELLTESDMEHTRRLES